MAVFLDLAQQFGPGLLRGLTITLLLTALGLFGSLILGPFLAFGRMSKRPWLHWPAVTYIELVRGTPIILMLFLVYFGLPRFAILLPPIPAAAIAFSINGGAFMAEIIRSGIQSIDRGQFEAADALGLSWARTMTRIVAPQATYVILPPVVNFGIELLKLTSIALVIAVPEVTYYAYNAIAETFRTFELLGMAALIYILVSVPLSQAVHVLEQRLGARR